MRNLKSLSGFQTIILGLIGLNTILLFVLCSNSTGSNQGFNVLVTDSKDSKYNILKQTVCSKGFRSCLNEESQCDFRFFDEELAKKFQQLEIETNSKLIASKIVSNSICRVITQDSNGLRGFDVDVREGANYAYFYGIERIVETGIREGEL